MPREPVRAALVLLLMLAIVVEKKVSLNLSGNGQQGGERVGGHLPQHYVPVQIVSFVGNRRCTRLPDRRAVGILL